MKLRPLPHQIEARDFLVEREIAFLLDAPRVGKSLPAVLAADKIQARRICVVTTKSGVPVWDKVFRDNQSIPRAIGTGVGVTAVADFVWIIPWSQIGAAKFTSFYATVQFDLLIIDEAHNAKNPEAKRTEALYGTLMHDKLRELKARPSLASRARVRWILTGTLFAHDFGDAHIHLRALTPTRLLPYPAHGLPTDVTTREDFLNQYTKRKPWKPNHPYAQTKWIVVANLRGEELRIRMRNIFLRRTIGDIGALEPRRSMVPLKVSESHMRAVERMLDLKAIRAAIGSGDMGKLEQNFSKAAHEIGIIKAPSVAELVADDLDGGEEKIIIAYWHRDVGNVLRDKLKDYGVVGIDGQSTDWQRAQALQAFQNGSAKVFLAQIAAAGEAIDLSAAGKMIFAEQIYQPGLLFQASQRIVNVNRTNAPIIEVAYVPGTIDETVQEGIARLSWNLNDPVTQE